MSSLQTTELVPELRAHVTRLRELASAAEELLAGLSLEQLRWKPGPDRWSVAEVLGHVNSVNRQYLDYCDEQIRRGREQGKLSDGPFHYGRLETWFVDQLEPSAKRRLKAPGAFAPARSDASGSEPAELKSGLDRLQQAIVSANGLDLARIKVRSPVSALLRFRLGAAFRLMVAHTDRHLLQATSVTETAGFPPSGDDS